MRRWLHVQCWRVNVEEGARARLSIASTHHATMCPHPPSTHPHATTLRTSSTLTPLPRWEMLPAAPIQLSPPARCTEAGFFGATISLVRGRSARRPCPISTSSPPSDVAASCAAPLLLDAEDLPWRQILATLRWPTTTGRADPHAHSHSFCAKVLPTQCRSYTPSRCPREGRRTMTAERRSGCRGHLRLAVPPHAPHTPTQCCLAMLQCEVTAPAVSHRGFARSLRHFHGRMPDCGNGTNDPSCRSSRCHAALWGRAPSSSSNPVEMRGARSCPPLQHSGLIWTQIDRAGCAHVHFHGAPGGQGESTQLPASIQASTTARRSCLGQASSAL